MVEQELYLSSLNFLLPVGSGLGNKPDYSFSDPNQSWNAAACISTLGLFKHKLKEVLRWGLV